MRQAAACKSMAEIAFDRESRAAWIGMAERWRRCAELARQQDVSQVSHSRQRRQAKTWSH
jgi:hypothetical protein